jgi:tripartite-type tricarboxylate transporter receptor subunit TctC
MSLKLDLVHVPFNSGGLAIVSTLAGDTPISFGVPAPSSAYVRDGSLRALAVTSKTRSPALSEVPTMSESGYPDIEGEQWYAVIVPAGTPKEVIATLYREIVDIVALPDVRERLLAFGFEPVADTPDEFAGEIKMEVAKWAKVIHDAGIRAN